MAGGTPVGEGIPHGSRGRHARTVGWRQQAEVPGPQSFHGPGEALWRGLEQVHSAQNGT